MASPVVTVDAPVVMLVPVAPISARSSEQPKAPQTKKLVTKGFRITPEAAKEFNVLKAEVESDGNGKDKGPALIAEALNMLFKKYGKPPIA